MEDKPASKKQIDFIIHLGDEFPERFDEVMAMVKDRFGIEDIYSDQLTSRHASAIINDIQRKGGSTSARLNNLTARIARIEEYIGLNDHKNCEGK